jgi:hypothetical protein
MTNLTPMAKFDPIIIDFKKLHTPLEKVKIGILSVLTVLTILLLSCCLLCFSTLFKGCIKGIIHLCIIIQIVAGIFQIFRRIFLFICDRNTTRNTIAEEMEYHHARPNVTLQLRNSNVRKRKNETENRRSILKQQETDSEEEMELFSPSHYSTNQTKRTNSSDSSNNIKKLNRQINQQNSAFRTIYIPWKLYQITKLHSPPINAT